MLVTNITFDFHNVYVSPKMSSTICVLEVVHNYKCTLPWTKKKLKMRMKTFVKVDFVPKQISGFASTQESLLYFPIWSLSSKPSKHVIGGGECVSILWWRILFETFPTLLWKFAKLNFPFSTTFTTKQAILSATIYWWRDKYHLIGWLSTR